MRIRTAPAVAVVVGVLLLGTLGLAGCDGYNDERGKGDAPVGRTDDSKAEVLNFPNGFGNVAMKCDGHGHRIYQVTGDAETGRPSPVVVADPTCPGGPTPTPGPR